MTTTAGRRSRDLAAALASAWLFSAGVVLAAGSEAAPEAAPASALKPVRASVPPAIDGRLDDPVWRDAAPLTAFRSFIPDFGRDPSERTEAFAAYDAENLYFAFRCHDREPAKIKAAVASRDTIRPDDYVCVNLDTFADRQSLCAFYVNPLGVQADSRFAGGQEDFSVDFVWASAGAIDAGGYAVELRIPFKSIRFAGGRRVEMAVFFERRISRRAEHVSCPALDPAKGYAFLTQMAPLVLEDVRAGTLLEAIPAFTYTHRSARDGGLLRRERSLGELGLTGKYGLSSQLVLDMAVNPDFSQVEADAGQVDVNLRSDLFYAEKRPFFLEGSDIFNLAMPDAHSALKSIVHTRRIVDPRAGLKLTGKVGARDAVGSILALDELPPAGSAGTAPGGARAGFVVGRYKRALADEGYVGAFYAGRERGGDVNRVAGADGMTRLGPSSTIGFQGFGSWTRVGNGGEAMTGSAMTVDYLWESRNLYLAAGVHDISRDFAADSGYLTRTGLTDAHVGVMPHLYPRGGPVRKIDLSLDGSMLRDAESGLTETSDAFSAKALVGGNTTLSVDARYGTEIYRGRRFDVSGLKVGAVSQVSKRLSITAQARRGGVVRYVEDPFPGTGTTLSLVSTYRPAETFGWDLRLTYADFFRKPDGARVFDYGIVRNAWTYQPNRYFFLRAIAEYNSFRRRLLGDLLASFTYVPGTVLQLGYGSLYERVEWDGVNYRESDRFLEMRRGVFFKASYLWRL